MGGHGMAWEHEGSGKALKGTLQVRGGGPRACLP